MTIIFNFFLSKYFVKLIHSFKLEFFFLLYDDSLKVRVTNFLFDNLSSMILSEKILLITTGLKIFFCFSSVAHINVCFYSQKKIFLGKCSYIDLLNF